MYLLFLNNFCIESLSEARDKAEVARFRSDFSTDDDDLLIKSTDDPNSPASVLSIPVYSGKCLYLFFIYLILN